MGLGVQFSRVRILNAFFFGQECFKFVYIHAYLIFLGSAPIRNGGKMPSQKGILSN